ncbi:MAG: flagellar hook-associated protein FlgK [Pseudomonadota bacterium]
MSGSDIFSVGTSGLLVFQRALATTSHNIANVNTEGYSRQQVDFSTRPPQGGSGGYIGTGVQADSVRRAYDGFLTTQVRNNTSANSQLQNFYQLANQVDNLLADPQTGLAPGLQSFFSAVQGVANDPASIPARQVLLSTGQLLTDRFHAINQQLTDQRNSANSQLQTIVTEINSLATALAKINADIVSAQGAFATQPPNDLLDQRDALLNQLAQRVAVTAVPEGNGALNVFIGNGQGLVVGSQASSLSVVQNSFDPNRSEIAYLGGSATVTISDNLSGGTLGSVLDFRRQILDSAQNALGRVAVGLSATFNAQHVLGQDLNGALGANFFSVGAPDVLARSGGSPNTGNGVVAATVANVNQLTTSDYRLQNSGGTYTLTRLSDNTVTTLASFPGTPVTVDGVTISLTSGTINSGDSFLIRPTRPAAATVNVALSDARKIAAAAPIRTSASLSNAGTGAISPGTVSNTTNLPLAGPITLTFNSALNQFTVAGGPGGTLAYNPATDSGGKQFTFSTYGGIAFTVSGVPANGDTFTIGNNTGGVSDNRNALLLGGLQNQLLLGGGTVSLQGAYGQLVAEVGAVTHQADINSKAQEGLLNQVTQARDAVSGVNLDEEAANMIRFQQAYQASAQIIALAGTLFDTLLGALRR